MAVKKNFKESLSRLEEIVNEIEDNSTGLEKSLKLYTEGVELSAYCAKQLKNAEQKITVLKEKYEGVFEQKKFDLSDE